MGWAMAQQMMQQQGGIAGSQTTPPAAPPQAAAMPDLLGPAEAAKILGVSEEDVLAVLSSGELKGKRIGSSWRITRTAIDEFLKS
jgi:excisionase family DNA binding protein